MMDAATPQRPRLYAPAARASNHLAVWTRIWRWVVWSGLALLALGNIAAGPPILRDGAASPLRLTAGEIQAIQASRTGPLIDAASAVLLDRVSDTVLWDLRAETSLPMASTTKLMTVLVALESLDPDQVLVVPGAALIGDASMGLQAGDVVTVRTLLYGALLPSGNDAAMTLAFATAGSEAAFVDLMNEHARAWGLGGTTFANPHGLDAPGHVSTALDLARLGRRAVAEPLLAEIVSAPAATVEGYYLPNTNELLGVYPGAYGIKTGTTPAAGQVLIAAAARQEGDAIAVVMASSDRYRDAASILDFYFAHWRWVDLRLAQNALNYLKAPDGAVYALRTAGQPLFLAKWQADELRFFRQISFDAENRPSGVLRVWLGEQSLAELPLIFLRLAAGPGDPSPGGGA